MLRGEIWYGIWPNDPNKTQRPLLIVSNNHRNSAPYIEDLLIVKITSLQRHDGIKKPVNAAEDFLIILCKESIIRCASIFTVEKIALTKKLKQLTVDQVREVDLRLKNSLDLN